MEERLFSSAAWGLLGLVWLKEQDAAGAKHGKAGKAVEGCNYRDLVAMYDSKREVG